MSDKNYRDNQMGIDSKKRCQNIFYYDNVYRSSDTGVVVDYEFPLPLDRQLGFGLYSAFMAVNRTYKPWLDRLGLTYPQYLVLSVLWEGDDQSIGSIASRLDLEPSTITPLVKRLEQSGHVVRQRNPSDERQVKVTLTHKGRAVRAETRTLADALYSKAGMSVAEIAEINQRVTALRDAFRGS